MPKLSANIEKQIAKVIHEALELADLGGNRIDSHSIAERLYESQAELMEQLKPFWMVERLNWMICRERRTRRLLQRPDEQLTLPGFVGLPRTITLPDARRQRLDYATVTEVRQHVKMLRNRLDSDSRILQMESVLKLMESYAVQDRFITWGEVKKRELGKL
jgi:hypothetical protein